MACKRPYSEATMMANGTRCNTVPIEKGTETELSFQFSVPCTSDDATPSPSRRGLKQRRSWRVVPNRWGCNTVPIEKGTETSN